MSIIGLVILAFAVLFIFIFNDMILKRNVVESAYAAVRGLLKMRCDFLDTLSPDDGNAQAMQEVAAAMRKADIARQIELDSQLTALTTEYLAEKSEATELAELEEKLIDARSMYNSAVNSFNRAAAVHPGKLVAKLRKWSPYPEWQEPAQ